MIGLPYLREAVSAMGHAYITEAQYRQYAASNKIPQPEHGKIQSTKRSSTVAAVKAAMVTITAAV